MTTAQSTIGRRDRKRLETRGRLEDAAVFLVLRDGPEHTTVDAISELADVSPRTFFNYFESKDGAILGVQQAEMSEQLVADHIANGHHQDPIESVVRLLLSVMGAPFTSRPAVHQDRLEVLRRHPEILAGQLARLNERADRLTAATKAVLGEHAQFDGVDAHGAGYADVMLAMCGGAVRVALREWAAAPTTSDIDGVQHRAASLVHELVGKLS